VADPADPAVFAVEAGKDNKVEAEVEARCKEKGVVAFPRKAARHTPLTVFVVEQHRAALE